MSRRQRDGIIQIWWRDIPAQVTGTFGEQRSKRLLPERFQHAIDRAAGVGDVTDAHSYVEQWRRVAVALPADCTDLEAVVAEEAERLETTHGRDQLTTLVRNGGWQQSPFPLSGDER